MDVSYILFNTLIYGSVGLVMAGYFAYGKFINFSIGALLTMMGYSIYNIAIHGLSLQNIFMLCALVLIYLGTNRIMLKYFPNTRQKDHAGLVITLGLNIFIQNMVNYVYGPSAIGTHFFSVGPRTLGILILCISGIFYYIIKGSLLGKIYTGIEENAKIIDSLGIRATQLLHGMFGGLFGLLAMNAFLIINETSLRASDGVFYLIKGIGIMILVGIGKKEYIFLGALLYVLLEYLLFISRGLPIAYKETLVLVIILAVLLWKPEGLFMIRKRKI